MKHLVKLIGFAFMVVLLACSDDENGTSPTNGNDNGDPPANTVGMTPSSFTPAQLTIKVGETVTWNNTNSMLHTVTSDDGLFDANVQPGASFAYTFDTAGTYAYVCTLHPGMAGTIVVE
jgi:plastocyanin